MANEKQPIPGSRGARADDVRKALDVTRQQFAAVLAKTAKDRGLTEGGAWTPTRVSKVILGRKPLSLDDAAAVVAADPQKRGWDWFVYGDDSATARRATPGKGAPIMPAGRPEQRRRKEG